MKISNKKGFTLIELSIVLIIISLIVAGVVGGKSLIHSAEIRNIVSEVSNIKTSLNTFNQQYNYLPGDLPDADEYWPSYGNNYCTGASLFEGDGDGLIYHDYESRYVWIHLLEAKLLEGRSNNSNFCTTRTTKSFNGEWRLWDTDNFGGGTGKLLTMSYC